MQFTNPHSNGLPIWGEANSGTTFIWEYEPRQQTGYYVTFWWSNNGNFLWDGGGSNTYYGCHPYPRDPGTGRANGTVHDWELAGMDSGADFTTTRGGSVKQVVKDVLYTQGFRVTHNGGTKTGIFYIDLPSVANADVIEATSPNGWGDTNPPSPAVTFGDAPWYADFQHERMSGILRRVKIFNKVLSEADMLEEAANMGSLVTSAGQASIWWGKTHYESVDDLTCDYGTGRTFAWADANNKATLWTG